MAVGRQAPPAPPLLNDQWAASSQFPVPPTQYRSSEAAVLIVQPVLLPRSTELFAVKIAPPVALMSLSDRYSPVTVPVDLLILAWLPFADD